MLDKALRSNKDLFRDGELEKLSKALDGLKTLVARRNEICHGYCTRHTASENGVLKIDGHFLIPAISEAGPMERPTDMQNALTADDIYIFIKQLRLHRSVVLDASGIITMRVQDERDKAAGRANTYGLGYDPWEQTF